MTNTVNVVIRVKNVVYVVPNGIRKGKTNPPRLRVRKKSPNAEKEKELGNRENEILKQGEKDEGYCN